MTPPNTHPFRTGAAHALAGKPYSNPWSTRFRDLLRGLQYDIGYSRGSHLRWYLELKQRARGGLS